MGNESKKSNVHAGHRKRLKSQALAHGLDEMPAYQALELLLYYAIPYKDTNELAHLLIDHFGSFSAVLNADYYDLLKVPGVGQNTASLLTLMPEFFRYFQRDSFSGDLFLRNWQELGEYAQSLFIGCSYERVYMICLNTRYKVLKTVLLSEGTLDSANINFRIAVEAALRHHSKYVALAHNHPSGTFHPSSQDIQVTRDLGSSLMAVEISLVDHVIVAGDSFYSLSEHGFFRGRGLPAPRI